MSGPVALFGLSVANEILGASGAAVSVRSLVVARRTVALSTD